MKKTSSGTKLGAAATPTKTPATPAASAPSKEQLGNKNKLFVGGLTNLSANLEEVLTNHFSQYGVVIAVELPPPPIGMSATSGTNAIGFGFVTLKDSEVVSKLLSRQSEIINGRQVELRPYTLSNTSSPFLLKQNEAVKATLEIPAKVDKFLVVEELKNPGVLAVGKSHTWTVRVKNNYSSERQVSNILFLVNKPEFHLVDISNDPKKTIRRPFMLEPGGTFSFSISFDPRHKFFGIYRAPLAVCFKDFYTLKEIVVKVTDPEALQKLAPTTKFTPIEIDDIPRKIIPAFPPSRASTTHFHTPIETPYVVPIPEYAIPENVQAPVDMGKTMSETNFWKNKENHVARLHKLLYTEEAQQKKNLRKFDLREVTMDRVTMVMVGKAKQPPPEPCMRLLVPGLAEQRPSVLTGDSVYAWLPGTADYEYEGCVWRVEEKAVLLMFCVDFEHLFPPTTKFNVRFSFNRMHMRYMHRAVDTTDLSIIWPSATLPTTTFDIRDELAKSSKKLSASGNLINISSPSKAEKETPEQKLKLLDKQIADNPAQMRAVEAVAFGQHNHIPFLLFGSFGTGKTKTLIEMVRQVLKQTKNPHILICAHVNSSVDLIVEKLAAFLTPEKMFRLYAFHRSLSSVSGLIQTYTKITTTAEKEIFDVPPLADLMKFEVIVTTTMTSSTLHGIGIGQEHFTHIFIDEAAQTMEPEALIPLAMAKCGQTKVIMSGDDQQLGPKVYSPSCRHHGLALSIMERMVTQGVYNNRSDPTTSASLYTIYRSHPSISAIPSHLFYGGKLRSKVDTAKVTLHWSTLNNDFPVFFYGVEGQDAQEGDSPSFFNPEEALALVNFVQSMLQEMKLEERDICIISAYSKQIKVIRDILRSQRLFYVNVGGVDEMQGREYKVVIISTVRAKDSWHKWKSFDTQHHLGFISDPKRLNTAITRAQSLLVFVGDPYVLYRDPSFRFIIDYCIENNSYQNVPLKQVKEWKEPAAPVVTPSKPFAWGNPNGTSPNGSANTTPNGTPNGTPKEPHQTPPNGTPAKNSNSNSNATPNENSTNQDSEDMFEAASRVLTQHDAVKDTSKAASVAAPTHAATQAYHKDELLGVLNRFFDPAHPASGRDPSALAPLFAQAQVSEYSDELARKIVDAGTKVGRDESARAVGVLKVLAEQVSTLSEILTNIIAEQLVQLRTNITPKHSNYTGLFLGRVFKDKLIVKSPHALLVYLVPESDGQNVFLAEVLFSMTEILGQQEVLKVLENLKWDLSRIFNKPVLVLAKFLKEKKLQFLTPDLPETVNITPQTTPNPAQAKVNGRNSPVTNSPLRTSAPSFVPKNPNIPSPVLSQSATAVPVSTSPDSAAATIPIAPVPERTSSSNSNSLFENPPVPNNPNIPIHDPSLLHAASPQNGIAPNLLYPPAFQNPNFVIPPSFAGPSLANLQTLQHMQNMQNFNMGNFSRGPSQFTPSLFGPMPYPYLSPFMNMNMMNMNYNALGSMGAGTALGGSTGLSGPSSPSSTLMESEIRSDASEASDHRRDSLRQSSDEAPLYKTDDAGLDCLYEYEGKQLIVVKSGIPVPPMSVFFEGDSIKIEICVFNLDANINRTGNLVYVDLIAKQRTKQAQYVLPTLRSLHDAQQKQTKRGREGTRLVIGIPERFQVEQPKQGEYVLILILKPQPFPVSEKIIPSVIDDTVF